MLAAPPIILLGLGNPVVRDPERRGGKITRYATVAPNDKGLEHFRRAADLAAAWEPMDPP
jgi:hypothetical protein